ncbi:MAG: hypothetical protein ACFFDW_05185 [Candidatus Thorarchaeota archaeon]
MAPKKNIHSLIFTIIVAGTFLIFILLILGMFYYPGGSKFNFEQQGYSFSENYLSDLGRVYTFNAEYNLISRLLFALAITIGGIGLITFYLLMPKLLLYDLKVKKISLAGGIIGIISSLICISIAYIPMDINLTIHRTAVYMFGVICLPAHILLAIAIFYDKNYPNIYGWLFMCYSIFLTTYILLWIIFKFESPYTQEVTKIVGQKIILMLEATNVIIQSFGAQKIIQKQKNLDDNSIAV